MPSKYSLSGLTMIQPETSVHGYGPKKTNPKKSVPTHTYKNQLPAIDQD